MFKEQVEQVIHSQLPDAQIELEYLPQIEKWSGHVISAAFVDLSQGDRHRLLRKVLHQQLSAEQQQQLSIILTLSPAEHNAILAYS